MANLVKCPKCGGSNVRDYIENDYTVENDEINYGPYCFDCEDLIDSLEKGRLECPICGGEDLKLMGVRSSADAPHTIWLCKPCNSTFKRLFGESEG